MYLFYIGLFFGSYYFGVGFMMMIYYLYNLYKNLNRKNIMKALFFSSIYLLGYLNTILYVLLMNYNEIIKFLNNMYENNKMEMKLYTKRVMKTDFIVNGISQCNKPMEDLNKLIQRFNNHVYIKEVLTLLINSNYKDYIDALNHTTDTYINNIIESNEYFNKIKDTILHLCDTTHNTLLDNNIDNNINNMENMDEIMKAMFKEMNASTLVPIPPINMSNQNTPDINNLMTTLSVLNNLQQNQLNPLNLENSQINNQNRAQRRLAKKIKNRK